MLKGREAEDLYLTNLADLRGEAARLKGIKLDTEWLWLVRLDQPALESSNPSGRKADDSSVGFWSWYARCIHRVGSEPGGPTQMPLVWISMEGLAGLNAGLESGKNLVRITCLL
ncbi:hypothetical protein GII23_13200 [Stutzerimonas balearica]|uniref:hypothetical protein n=1 Tax=Stutzerimonas balearica TaxID=74829 RepID=UPI0013F3F698|nr:hypothetical protein [Stutzerimonas balearica]QIJ00962.1 hypothetical protein GII23_13200 [Stutzerimonas balearica]